MTRPHQPAADPASILRDLIRCPSVTPAEGGALDCLERLLEPRGFRCVRLPFEAPGTERVDNLFARFGTGAPHFCFAGHTDVVPPGDEASWTVPPFAAETVDGVLYGRGAVDMKGGVAAFAAAALDYLGARGEAFAGSISLLVTGDEEGPAVNGTVRMLQWLRDHGEVPDHCLVGEPSSVDRLGDTIKIGRRGSLNATLTVTGRQGHTAYPHKALNPVPGLVRMLDRLASERLDGGTAHFEPSTLAITSVDVGNPASNVIPERATARLNIRFNSEHTAESLERWVRDVCEAVTGEMGGTLELAFSSNADSFVTEPGPFVDLVAAAVGEATGVAPDLNTGGGTSDARFIKDYCPVVEFGPVNKTIHQVDERIPLDELVALTAVYRTLLERYFDRFSAGGAAG
ncbi:succinyl-diaminopimelate desuccinylase [Kaustia mangrovi]|uniref:Succinyl-diaminopimelate desuccinylase n=1 Tax=Kaustia mangrovi TaxID=2593653 RepID=A0A7S8C5N9_9HYPH|nr:succinyl-diaminopimelate desuccinylase [Kaustia mangrovi]QPC43839.1 succinyl-diaminopimelate desuccinylase [Kaustia mangrovi]